jgi:hypothetical protein
MYQIIDENFYRCETCGLPGLGGVQYSLQYKPSNGEYRLVEKNFFGTGTSIIYQDGTYRADALLDPKLFISGDPNQLTAEGQALSTRMRAAVWDKYKGLGGNANPNLKINDSVKPQNQAANPGVNNSYPGTTPPITGLPILTNPPGQGNIFDPGISVNVPFGLPDARERNQDSKLLTYPEDLLEQKQDTFRISRYEYTSPNKDIFGANPDIGSIISGVPRGNALFKEKIIGTVILPMPNMVTDSNTVAWADDNMNALTTAATALVSSDLGGTFATQAASFLGQLTSIPGADKIPQLVMLGNLASRTNDVNVQAQIKTALASFLLKKSGFEVSPESILARGSGVVPNSNLQLLFNNVTLREFGFSYKMTPRSTEEAKNVRRIIRFFKEGMAAKKITGTGGGTASFASLFLGTPDVFKLEYKSGNKDIKGVNKFKVCALQSFAVNYTAENQWQSYDDESAPGQPVSLIMQMRFKEIEPIYDTDYQTTTFGLNQPSISSADDVGF